MKYLINDGFIYFLDENTNQWVLVGKLTPESYELDNVDTIVTLNEPTEEDVKIIVAEINEKYVEYWETDKDDHIDLPGSKHLSKYATLKEKEEEPQNWSDTNYVEEIQENLVFPNMLGNYKHKETRNGFSLTTWMRLNEGGTTYNLHVMDDRHVYREEYFQVTPNNVLRKVTQK